MTDRPRPTIQFKKSRGPRIRLGAVIALAALVAFGAWLAINHKKSSNGGGTTTARTSGATSVSERGLKTVAGALSQPIYWKGPQTGVTYELTQTPDGRVYIRYLPKGAAAGSSVSYLTVATYPVANAFAATSAAARKSTDVKISAGKGEIAFYSKTRPTNVYLAYAGSDYQIEVYSPVAGDARRLVAKGLIRAVAAGKTTTTPASPQAGAVPATRAELKAAADKLGRPIYWAGAKSKTTYELTQTPDGRVYVRYLPAGVQAGSTGAYFTVATYPVQSAYATTSSAARESGAVKIAIAGGVAFYTNARPQSVYLAFPGTDEQVEVFDPSAARLHKLVAAGKIKPVS